MFYSSESLERLIGEFSKLPGIGRKTAQRLAFYILKLPMEDVEGLATALLDLKNRVQFCSICFNITEVDPCPICQDRTRDQSVICVVEEANDILAIEKTGQYRGLYHVLGGVLSPLDGIGPENLHIQELLQRIVDPVEEIIIATNPNVEGEATATYLSKLISPLGKKITRIARGIPAGSNLEFVDEITLLRALEGRNVMS
ncbi:recombination protein RecR [candidate division KSB1 bacterium]|nr:MAG: recombination protein RecR [candidate division KSB1 bacterium 4484_219]RKY76676.1 MAG: recombination protein RecR [candidate division KSB1 bacterium]RKY79903.1 MAG: recombination protein RecR [candidate division KSB1 bacterium]RKY93057.1 MAG: recombination protein RecR [candidate division KSB1 bacterium]HDI52009.1 recombination protein RecR [Bacteroidota bacterium]